MYFKERLKGIVAGFLAGLLAASTITYASVGYIQKALHYNDIKITLDNTAVTPSDANGNYVEPFIIDGTTYLPVRGVANALGLNVEWDDSSKTVALYSTPDKAHEKLTIATNSIFKPFVYYDDDKMAGIDIEIMEELTNIIGADCEYIDMDFNSIFEAVKIGMSDCGISALTVTESRKEKVDFTIPYFTNTGIVLTNNNSSIHSVDDLFSEDENYRIGALIDTTEYLYAIDDFGDLVLMSPHFDIENLMAELYDGIIDAVIINERTFEKEIKGKYHVNVLSEPYYCEEYAIAVSKDNPQLLLQLNNAITTLINNGTIEEIAQKYIK